MSTKNKLNNMSENVNERYLHNLRGLTKDQKLAVESLEEVGFQLISSPEQLQNGTLYFEDAKMKDTFYSIGASGYARRHDTTKPVVGYMPRERHYQLNKQVPKGGK